MLLGDARRLLQLEEAARHRLAAPRLSGTVRLVVVEEVAGGSLPPALGRFATLHPGVKLEVQIGVSAELINLMRGGSTSYSRSAHSEPRKGVWCGVSHWSGP